METVGRICTRCIMDQSDPGIDFDDLGHCNHCRRFFEVQSLAWFPDAEGERRWAEQVRAIRAAGRKREYDAIVGISGGLDSSYLALRLKEQGLRLLAVHVDGGWNSEVAVANIERLVKGLEIDLFTDVIDWEEMRDLQLAFFRAGVPNQDIPQDHAFFAQLFRTARRHRIGYFLSGHNLATESILPKAWGYNPMDARHVRGIHAQFGTGQLRTFPLMGAVDLKLVNPVLLHLHKLTPLDYTDYRTSRAQEALVAAVGWREYGEKHHESRLTRFIQCWYHPTRFGFDKRRAHLSSLVVSGQLSRDEALAAMAHEVYTDRMRREDQAYIAKKLGISAQEFTAICAGPPHRHEEYPTQLAQLARLRRIKAVGRSGVRMGRSAVSRVKAPGQRADAPPAGR